MVLRALRKARYDPVNLGHAGLASRAYCHFTSPIRRYPDLMVHRALVRHLEGRGPDSGAAEAVAAAAAHASEAERGAEALERRADAVCAAFLLEQELYDHGWDAGFPGEVVGLADAGAFVRFGGIFEGYLPGRAWSGGPQVAKDALGVALIAAGSARRLRLGDPVRISVAEVDRASGRVRVRGERAP
jgi:ribonuclease R